MLKILIIRMAMSVVPFRLRQIVKRAFPKFTLTFEEMLESKHLKSVKKFEPKAKFFDERADQREIEVFVGTQGERSLRIYSPLPPRISGIATFTQKIASELQNHALISLRNSVPISKLGDIPGVRTFLYDDGLENVENLYMLGNGPDHISTWKMIHRKAGHIFLHDVKLPDLPVLPEEGQEWKHKDYNYKANFSAQRFPKFTKSIIVMSDEAKEMIVRQLGAQNYKIPIHVLSKGHPVLVPIEIAKPRNEKIKIATFGFQNVQKDPILTYKSIAKLCKAVGGNGLIAGKTTLGLRASAYFIWLSHGNRLGGLKVLSKLTDEDFFKQMLTVDLAIQLRRYSNGETSGLIPMLAAAGVPTIVSEIGSFRELPSDVFMKLDPGLAINDEQCSQISQILRSEESYRAWAENTIKWAKDKDANELALELLEILNGNTIEQND